MNDNYTSELAISLETAVEEEVERPERLPLWLKFWGTVIASSAFAVGLTYWLNN